MIKHIVILLWNQKRKYLALMLEHVLVFAILMVCMVSLFNAAAQYQSPGLLDSKNTFYIGYMMHNGYTRENMDQIGYTMDAIIESMKKRPYVQAISESIQFIPYLRPSEYFWGDSLAFSSGHKLYVHTKATDAAAETVFRPKLEAGHWFEDGERPNGKYPAVVTAQLVEKAGLNDPLGKTINCNNQVYEIVGVIAGLKESAFEPSMEAIIVPISSWQRISFYREYAIRILPGYEDDLYDDYFKEFTRMGGRTQFVEPILSDLSQWRSDTMTRTITEVAFATIPTVFLVVFAFFGTLGLNLMDTKARTRELALRIAIGSNRGKVVKLLLLQNILMSSLAAIPGLIVAFYAYELDTITVTAIVTTLGIILLFSILSALYPAMMISRMNPAQSLKYE